MYIHIRGASFEFMAATKGRYYDCRRDEFVDVKPGIRLHVHTQRSNWVLTNKGFINLNKQAKAFFATNAADFRGPDWG